MSKNQYVPGVHYQEERAAILYTVYATAKADLGFDALPVWEELDDRDRTAWLLVAVEPMPAESANFIE